jgi:hypothetical protein
MRPTWSGVPPVYVEQGQDKAMPEGDDRFDLPIDELARDRFILGDPEQCVAEMARYVEAGFN